MNDREEYIRRTVAADKLLFWVTLAIGAVLGLGIGAMAMFFLRA